MINVEKTTFGPWKDCYRLAHSTVELVALAERGPRLLRYGFPGGKNELAEIPMDPASPWQILGGHRLWHAPERFPRSYSADDQPVAITSGDSWLTLTQAVEKDTGIRKEMEVRLFEGSSRVRISHRLTNTGLWELELAPWALTVMRGGGRCIIPLPPRGTHPEDLPPTNSLALWAFTDMADFRWTWGTRFITLRQAAGVLRPQKVGAMVPAGWVAHWNEGSLFIKRVSFQQKAAYPDMGCNVEAYSNDRFLEVETLGPLCRLDQGQTVEHVEDWFLYPGVPCPDSESLIERHVLPLVAASLTELEA